MHGLFSLGTRRRCRRRRMTSSCPSLRSSARSRSAQNGSAQSSRASSMQWKTRLTSRESLSFPSLMKVSQVWRRRCCGSSLGPVSQGHYDCSCKTS